MSTLIRILGVAGLVLWLQGCANWNSIFHEFNVGSDAKATKSITIDVKQRAVLSGSLVRQDKAGNMVERTVICAEPSPDALSVYAAGLSGSAYSGDKKALDLALTQSETGSFIGNRTVTIQLLRDNLYRACEAYMSGALTDGQYYALIRRYQVMTMGLLAIEHLTETVKPGPVTIAAGAASSSLAGDPQVVDKAANALAEAKANQTLSAERRDALKEALDSARKAADEAPADTSLKAKADSAQKAYDAAKKQALVDANKAQLASDAYDGVKGGGAGLAVSVKGGALLGAATQGSAKATLATEAVAATVSQIVTSTIGEGFKLDDCLSGDDACFSDAQKRAAIQVAQDACKAKEGDGQDAYSMCVLPVLGLFKMGLADAADLVHQADLNAANVAQASAEAVVGATGPRTGVQPGLPVTAASTVVQPSPFSSFARGLSKGGAAVAFNLDVFYVDPQDPAFSAIRGSNIDSQFARVRYRSVSRADCEQKFTIDGSHAAVIRYDDNESERPVKDALLQFLGGVKLKSGQAIDAVAEKVNWTPTALYISVFLCKKQH